MKPFPKAAALLCIARISIVSFLTLTLSALLLESCKKEFFPLEKSVPTLSIEEARQFFATKNVAKPTSLRSDSLEGDLKPLEPNWEKAISYYDEAKKQSVVEVGLYDSRFSRVLYNPDNVTVDTSLFFQTPPNNKLLIIKDTAGIIDYAIMKIEGSYQYTIGPGLIDSNSYEKINEQFKGFINYVDINDSVKLSYYMAGGRYAKIDSTYKDTPLQGALQERWGQICITIRISVPCNCVGHNMDQTCVCANQGGDHHNPYWQEIVSCFDVYVITGPIPSGYISGVPIFYSDPGSGWGASGGNNTSTPPSFPFQSSYAYNVATFDSDYGTDLTTDYEDIALKCGQTSSSFIEFEDCVKSGMIDDLVTRNPEISLSEQDKSWLKDQFDILIGMERFLIDENSSISSQNFVEFCITLIQNDKEFKWDRLEEFFLLIEDNPNELVENCDPHYSNWSDLASFVLSGAPLQRIQNSNGTWDIQEIQNAYGTRVNLDEFSVKVQTLPSLNGSQMTAKQLLDHIRKHINDFAPTFTPYDAPYDWDLWYSDNPLASVMQIQMSALSGFIDGDVIVSQYEECCWVFTTLKGPFYASGDHPVSGNRQFGYRIASDGIGFEFYCKGADRTTQPWHALNNSGFAFEQADALWTGFQDNILEFVNTHNGNAPSTQYITNRPNWDDVKAMLKSDSPITSIPCH